jgi:hypothetical protein
MVKKGMERETRSKARKRLPSRQRRLKPSKPPIRAWTHVAKAGLPQSVQQSESAQAVLEWCRENLDHDKVRLLAKYLMLLDALTAPHARYTNRTTARLRSICRRLVTNMGATADAVQAFLDSPLPLLVGPDVLAFADLLRSQVCEHARREFVVEVLGDKWENVLRARISALLGTEQAPHDRRVGVLVAAVLDHNRPTRRPKISRVKQRSPEADERRAGAAQKEWRHDHQSLVRAMRTELDHVNAHLIRRSLVLGVRRQSGTK